jgi:signal transduction histidine kinase
VDLLLHKKTLDPGVRDKLEAVREQVSFLTALVDSLTGYSRVASAAPTLVDVRRPIHLALSIFPVLQNKGRYRLESSVPDDLPPVRGSLNAIQQVVVNVLKNAKDALDDVGGGRLALRAWHDEASDELRIRVEDAGRGVAPEAREKLFQPFFTTKQEGVGTGLGLTVCRQIMEDHGGRIEVESPVSPEGGTAFTLCFPAVRDAALAAR